MLKNCSLSAHYFRVYGCYGVDGEKYLGTVQRLCDTLELCRSYEFKYDVFGSDVFLGCIGSNDLKF